MNVILNTKRQEKQYDNNNNKNNSLYTVGDIQLNIIIYADGTCGLVVEQMSKFDPQDIKIDELERALNLEMIKNCIMQSALQHIASDTEEHRQTVAQETLEAIAVAK